MPSWQASSRSWAFVNVNVRPYYSEGSKTLAFEVAEQLGWQLPDHVVVPIASGSQLTKIDKGFRELVELGLVEDTGGVRITGAQAEGCSPVATAFAEGATMCGRSNPRGSRSRSPSGTGRRLVRPGGRRRSGGAMAAVTDAEIVEGIRLLARTEGIFAETAGGVTVATLAKLAAAGVIRPDERVVIYVTGNGLKTVEALAGSRRAVGDDLPRHSKPCRN